VAAFVAACSPTAPAAAQAFWLTPAPGSIDYLDLASREWLVRLTGDVAVIQFYMQNLMSRRIESVGPNTVQAFVSRGTFHHLRRLGFRIAMEAGVVKPYWCGDLNAREAIDASAGAIRNVHQAQGRVDYVSMDEPFINGIDRCTMLEAQVADRTASYIKGLRQAFQGLRVGMTEAYPRFDVERLATFEALLRHRGARLDFYHLDLHLSEALRTRSMAQIEQDVRMLCDHLQARGIPFGLIIWGEDGRSDFLYADAAMKLVRLTRALFHGARRPPAHVPLQSWTATPEGRVMVPRNLPPEEEATHLNLLRRARGCVLNGAGCD
jgi:hypothetical protein